MIIGARVEREKTVRKEVQEKRREEEEYLRDWKGRRRYWR